MDVELRVEARNDLYLAAAFYEDQREELGEEFIDAVFADLSTLEHHGGTHRIVHGCHRKLTTRFPFAIFYVIADSTVDVIAILDCRQDPKKTLDRLKTN